MLSTAGRSILPGKIAALADAKNLAETLDGEFLLRRIDETEPHRLPSLAKKGPLQDLAFLPQDLILAPQPLQLSRQVLLPFGRRRSISRSRRLSSQRRSVERPTPRSMAISLCVHHSPQPTERLRLQIPSRTSLRLAHEILLFPSEELSTFLGLVDNTAIMVVSSAANVIHRNVPPKRFTSAMLTPDQPACFP